jgi:hypothetical protein
MELLESHTHSFVIKIRLEETAAKKNKVVWRGQITHVPSGKRRFFEHLHEIPLFITPYLQDMGVQPGACWRVRQWLKQRILLQKRR